jgi:redox-sensitive bicupin YhaK (pirin superfamily)
MIRIRKSEDRGSSNLGWLKSKHTFSFGHYHDLEHIGFESLRVINDDRVVAGAGFGTHPHNNMEIISYVLDGALEHKDSMGNGSIIKPGEVQRLSAGTGMTHSEYNHSKTDNVHFLQIWFLPDKHNVKPSYEQKAFSDEEKLGTFKLVASKTGRDGSISINQDVDMSVALLDGERQATYVSTTDRALWVHVARGDITMNGHHLHTGDGVAIVDEKSLSFNKGVKAEVIIFDMQPLSRSA